MPTAIPFAALTPLSIDSLIQTVVGCAAAATFAYRVLNREFKRSGPDGTDTDGERTSARIWRERYERLRLRCAAAVRGLRERMADERDRRITAEAESNLYRRLLEERDGDDDGPRPAA